MPEINYFWDEIEDNVVREYDENNNTIASYATEPTLYGSVLSQNRSGQKRHYQFDGQGNTTELTDASGAVTDTRRYSAFGTTMASSGATSTPFGFGGRWGYHSSATATPHLIRRRQLDIDRMRWFSFDPLISGNSVIVQHPYVYARNAPVGGVDPSGMICMAQAILLKKNAKCGDDVGYNWTVSFHGKEGENGFILQKVTTQYCAMTCTCDEAYVALSWCKTKKTGSSRFVGPEAEEQFWRCMHGGYLDEYWELWVVKNGKVLDHELNPGGTDTFSIEAGFSAIGSAGIARHEGQLYFIPNGDTGAYPGGIDIWEVNKTSPARLTIMSCETEKVEALVANIKPFGFRRVKKEWECCEGSTLPIPRITSEFSPECK